MRSIAKLRVILATALGTLTVGCVILFLGMVTAVRADLTSLIVDVVPDSLTANSGQTATVTAIVTGNPIVGVVVTFSLSSSNLGSVTTPTGTTDINGYVTATWTAGTVLGTGTLTVTDGTVTGTGTAAITLTAGLPATITVVPDPATVTAGATQTFTATGEDLHHNAVPITPTWTSNVGTATSATDGLTATSIFIARTSPAPATGAITATYSGISGTAVVKVIPGAVATITVSPDPVTVTVGTTQSFTATGQDLYHNAVLITPTWSSNVGSAAGVSNGLTATAVFTAQGSPAPATGTLMATYDNVADTTSVNIVPGAPNMVTLWATQPSVVVGGNSPLKAYVTDRFNNNVANGTLVTFASSLGDTPPPDTTFGGFAASVSHSTIAGTAYITATSEGVTGTTRVTFFPGQPFSITLQANPVTQMVGSDSMLTATVYDQYHNVVSDVITVTFSRSLGDLAPTVVTTTNGVATSRISDTLAGPKFITATSQPPALEGTTTVTFTPDVPFTVTMTAQPITQTVGNNSVLTAMVNDQYGNWVTNGTPVTFTVSHGYVVSRTTTASGVATSLFSDTLAGPQGSLRIITATSGLTLDTATVTFMPGAPFSMTLQASPSSVTVTVPSLLDATVYDQYGNFVLDGTLVTLDKDLGSVLSPVTTTSGLARSSISYPYVATAHITATSGVVTRTTMVTFTPDVPASVSLQASPTPQIVGSNSVLTATVRDWVGNLVADGTPITFTISHGYVVSQTITMGGVATSLISDTLAGTRIITATSTPAPSVTTTVVFDPDAPYSMTLVAVPTLPVVGNNSVLTATVFDQYHNTVMNNTLVTFTASRGNVVSPVTTTSGMARSLISDTLAGTRLITATSGQAQITTTVIFMPGAPYTITVLVNPITLVANSGMTATITATIMDVYDNPLAGQTLTGTFPITTMGTVSGLGVTDVAGQAFGTWEAGSALGRAPLHVSNGSITGTKDVSLVGSAPTTVTVQVSPSVLIASSGMTGTITATVMDICGNPLPDVGLSGSTVPPTTLGSVGAFDFTDNNGRAIGTWTAASGSAVGSGLLRVSASSNVSGTAAVTLTFSMATTVTLDVNPATLVAWSGATATITATVTDRYDNRVPNVTLGIYITPTTVGNVNWPSPTNTDGQAFGTWRAGTVPGSGQLQGGSISITGTTTITLDPVRIYLPVIMKNFPPLPTNPSVIINNGAEYTYQTTVTLELTATIENDYIAWVRLGNDNIQWSDWLTFTPTATWTLEYANGLKTVYAQLMGSHGGFSSIVSDQILLFKNGDFSQPNLADWNVDRHYLSVTASTDPSFLGNPVGLLGNPAYPCDGVPSGYGSLSQSFIMPNVPPGKKLFLRFSYHIITSDQNHGLKDYLDRFEVLFNNPPPVMQDMNERYQFGCQYVYDLLRQDARIEVPVQRYNAGDNIKVDFRLYNDDVDQMYNTYVYLDDVRLQFQQAAP